MKRIIFLIGILGCPLSASAEENCFNITGQFKLWNGWEPALRLNDEVTGLIYGVSENSEIPEAMLKGVQSKQSISGKFCLVKTGDNVKVPYQKQEIIMVEVKKYSENK